MEIMKVMRIIGIFFPSDQKLFSDRMSIFALGSISFHNRSNSDQDNLNCAKLG
jgi:hypothetical protein